MWLRNESVVAVVAVVVAVAVVYAALAVVLAVTEALADDVIAVLADDDSGCHFDCG